MLALPLSETVADGGFPVKESAVVPTAMLATTGVPLVTVSVFVTFLEAILETVSWTEYVPSAVTLRVALVHEGDIKMGLPGPEMICH